MHEINLYTITFANYRKTDKKLEKNSSTYVRGVMVNVMVCGIVVSEFKLQSRY